MATMIPDIDPGLIENSGEQRFYTAASDLPNSYTVLYGYKFSVEGWEGNRDRLFYEADFIIVHPSMGYLVVEVKEGHYMYSGNQWLKQLGQDYVVVDTDLVEQAKRAMFKVLERYKNVTNSNNFPLKIRYAVCFPDCSKVTGMIPAHLTEESIWLREDLEGLERSITAVFGGSARQSEGASADLLIKKVLAPSFRVFSDLNAQMEMFYRSAERTLTDEQERILEETSLDRRKIFLGAAGTGKTFIAMEKVRILVAKGNRVLLTCFNRNLGFYLQRELSAEVKTGQLTATNFHDLLINKLKESGQEINVPENSEERPVFFRDVLPVKAFDLFMSMPEDEKYDSLVVDEGQDFREEWFPVLQSILRDGDYGEFYIFADPCQSLFNTDNDFLASFKVSMHRLTRNLRNTEAINTWLSKLIPEANLRATQKGGIPVGFFPWDNQDEELRMVEKELGRLVSQGIQPRKVVLLSPHVMDKSSFAGRDRIGQWPLYDAGRRDSDDKSHHANAVPFYTIRSYKGLEEGIIFLTGIREGSRVCTIPDIYVGSSRARFLLYVFHQRGAFRDRFPL